MSNCNPRSIKKDFQSIYVLYVYIFYHLSFQVDDLDIIIGGHTNTFLWSGKKPKYIKHAIIGDYPTVIGGKFKTLVVQTNGYGRYLGKLKVTFDSSGQISAYEGNPILLNNTYDVMFVLDT